MSDGRQPEDLERLGARLEKAREGTGHQGPDHGPGGQQPNNALGLAFRVGVELVSALAVGFGIGWLLDFWLETRPWLMLMFIILGGAAGILNVYRMARGFGYAAGYQNKQKPGQQKPGDQGPGIEG
jgi:ATP synthase protein I